MMTEIRGASNAKAKRELGWQPRYPSWRDGLRRGWPELIDATTALLEELRPAAFAIAYRMLGSVSEAEDVVQEALLRAAPGPASGRADRLAARLRRHGRHAAGDRPAALGAGAARELRRRVAARAARHRARPTTRPATPSWPTRSRSPSSCCSRACRRSSGRCSCCTTSSTTPTSEVAEIVGKSEANARQLAARARRHVEERRPRFEASPRAARGAGAALLRRGAATATWRRSRRCSPTTSCCTATAAARRPRSPGRLHGRDRVARTLSAWCEQAPAIGRRIDAPAEVNGQPGAIVRDGEGRRGRGHGARHRRRARSRPSTRSSTPTSWSTSASRPTSVRCCAAGASARGRPCPAPATRERTPRGPANRCRWSCRWSPLPGRRERAASCCAGRVSARARRAGSCRPRTAPPRSARRSSPPWGTRRARVPIQ